MEGGSDRHAHFTDKTGTRGGRRRESRGRAWAWRAGPAAGPLGAAPGPQSCGRAPRGSWQHTQSLGHAGRDRGFKNKRIKRTKTMRVMQRGAKISVFFPSGQIVSERVSSRDGERMAYPPPPGLPTSSTVPPFICCALSPSITTALHRNKQAGGEASSLTSGPSAHFPQLVGAPGDLWPHGPRCRHQGHTPQGKGFPALPTKAGWTVAGGWKEKGGGGGWQFPLACCCPCCVGGGWGPPGPGVCP